MHAIDDFTLTAAGSFSDVPHSTASHRTIHPACVVAGLELEGQYKLGNRFLLLATENSPYEEALHVTLLGANLDVIDTLSLSHHDSPGLVRDLEITENNSIQFSFFGDDLWLLTILDQPERWAWNQISTGVIHGYSRLFKKGYLNMRRIK